MDGLDKTPLPHRDASRAVQGGHVTALFQPIEALQTGECLGFEALARLPYQGDVLPPHLFMPHLDADDRLCLFGTMLGHAIAFLKEQQQAGHDFYVSLNVELSLIIGDDFVDVLQYFLERFDFSGERLVLELLENEQVTAMPCLRSRLDAIHALGLTFALDDIGSGYASLQNLMMLPIDIFKLDRIFCRNLEREPEHLLFVMSILVLARGLGKRLIIEGIESPEVYDALRILGVDYGQGFGIARPMPAAAVSGWVVSRTPRQADRVPTCLLGAYASHLTVVESCRALKRQPLPMRWTEDATDHCKCAVGRLFGPRRWHDTEFGRAHKAFHMLLPNFDLHAVAYERAVEAFRFAMRQALVDHPAAFRCEPVRNVGGAGGTIRPAPRKARRAMAAG